MEQQNIKTKINTKCIFSKKKTMRNYIIIIIINDLVGKKQIMSWDIEKSIITKLIITIVLKIRK